MILFKKLIGKNPSRPADIYLCCLKRSVARAGKVFFNLFPRRGRIPGFLIRDINYQFRAITVFVSRRKTNRISVVPEIHLHSGPVFDWRSYSVGGSARCRGCDTRRRPTPRSFMVLGNTFEFSTRSTRNPESSLSLVKKQSPSPFSRSVQSVLKNPFPRLVTVPTGWPMDFGVSMEAIFSLRPEMKYPV